MKFQIFYTGSRFNYNKCSHAKVCTMDLDAVDVGLHQQTEVSSLINGSNNIKENVRYKKETALWPGQEIKNVLGTSKSPRTKNITKFKNYN